MINFICNMLTSLSDKQAEIIVATIGLISATIVAVFGLLGSAITLFLNKRSERKMELRKIKESQYIEFLGSLAVARVASTEDKHEINSILSSRIQTIYLVGNKEVQTVLSKFLKILINGGVSSDEQAILYANLITAMKKDLYGKSKKSLTKISFTVFSD